MSDGRPFILVLAGVNGAGKSSLGGAAVHEAGLTWFNPDTVARSAMDDTGMSQQEANAYAWGAGVDQLKQAIVERTNFAFETTLGGNTVTRILTEASASHDLQIWYCGLKSPELHIQRVAERVALGGHDIPEEKIRERWLHSISNLIKLLDYTTELQVFDNSTQAADGEDIPEPILVLHWQDGHVLEPDRGDPATMAEVPDWAKPIVMAAFDLAAKLQKAG